MNAHSNAKLTPVSRAGMVRRVAGLHQPVAEAAAGVGISVRSAQKWLARFRAEGHFAEKAFDTFFLIFDRAKCWA